MLASLIIVAAVTMFVMEPRKAIGVAAAFCLVAGALWLYDARVTAQVVSAFSWYDTSTTR
jgi:hypothetical protein